MRTLVEERSVMATSPVLAGDVGGVVDAVAVRGASHLHRVTAIGKAGVAAVPVLPDGQNHEVEPDAESASGQTWPGPPVLLATAVGAALVAQHGAVPVRGRVAPECPPEAVEAAAATAGVVAARGVLVARHGAVPVRGRVVVHAAEVVHPTLAEEDVACGLVGEVVDQPTLAEGALRRACPDVVEVASL